jgi:hypothetical protein
VILPWQVSNRLRHFVPCTKPLADVSCKSANDHY